MDILYTFGLFVTLLLSAAAGWWARTKLHQRHVSTDAIDSIRLLMGMLLTFSALVLGLLTSSAKLRYDGYSNELGAYAVSLVELDHRLRTYGPETIPVHAMLRQYTAAAIADSWPDEPRPSGQYPLFHVAGERVGVENTALGGLLARVDDMIEGLEPADSRHREIVGRLRNRMSEIIGERWRLIFSAHSTLSLPFLLVLTSWLSIIFGIFGLTSPRNRLVYAVVVLSALSIASPLYLIISYSEAQNGRLKLPSGAMRAALSHIDEPD